MKIRELRQVTRFDLLNASVAALRDGLGPLYNLYLVGSLGFSPVQIGWVLAAGSAAQLVAQVPLGYLYDKINRKGLPIAGAAVIMCLAALTMKIWDTPTFQTTFLVQIVFGIANTALTLGIPALTVATTDDERLGDRMARNEVFAKAANLTTLALATGLTYVHTLKSIFFIWPLLSVPAFLLSAFSAKGRKAKPRAKWSRKALRSSGQSFHWFVVVTFLLYLSNTGALTLFEQVFAPAHVNGGAGWIAAATALAQGCVTLTIFQLAKVKTSRGLVTILGLTFVVIAGRLSLLASGAVVPVLALGQILDGVIDGVLFSIPIRLLAEQHRGEFNVLQGVLGATGACGALASTFATGPLMIRLHYPMALLAFLIPAFVGGLVTLYARRPLAGNSP